MRRPPARVRRDVDDEIRHHLGESAELLVEQGWEWEAALREAERRFGAVRRFRAEMLEVQGEGGAPRRGSGLGDLLREARHAARGLRKRPGFALPVVLTLALGIGAAAAAFSVVDAAMLRPLAYRHAERLVEVKPSNIGRSTGTLPLPALPDFLDGSRDFTDGWLAYRRVALVRTDGPAAEQLQALAVTPGADTLLGIPLLLGRGFTAEDARPGAPPVVVLGRAYFERLGGDRSLLGRTLRLESGPVTVVGVLAGGVRFPLYAMDPDLWVPLREDFTTLNRAASAGATDLWVRLLPDAGAEATAARAAALSEGLREQGLLPAERAVALLPLAERRLNEGTRRALWLLAGTVAVLFLIALVNGVNLLLVRSASRARELAVRIAIGGSRMGVLRLLLLEGLFLGLAAGAVAAAVAWLAVDLLRPILPSELLFLSPHAFGIEARTLRFTGAAALVAGLALGAVAALPFLLPRRGAPPLGSRPADDTPGARRLRDGLVVTQVALSMALLAAAGLFVKSFTTLLRVDAGFDVERVAFALVPLSEVRYPDAAARGDLVRRLVEALEARPEVEGVSVSGGGGFSFGVRLEAEGRLPPEAQPMIVPTGDVGPGHLTVTGTELVAGRDFRPGDAGSAAVIVDRDLARFLWGAEDALGRRFRLGEERPWLEVVGVVRELRLMGRDQRGGEHQILHPMDPGAPGSTVQIAVRTPGDPAALLPVIREALRTLDPEQYIWKLQTGAQALAEEEGQPRFLLTLMGLLAAVAVALACVGLYGVLAFSIARRQREIGVRVALGADRRRVRGMVLREGVWVAALGVALGSGVALLGARTLEPLLYEVGPGDPSALAGAGALLLAVAALASLLPAVRATRVDPVEVLRAE